MNNIQNVRNHWHASHSKELIQHKRCSADFSSSDKRMQRFRLELRQWLAADLQLCITSQCSSLCCWVCWFEQLVTSGRILRTITPIHTWHSCILCTITPVHTWHSCIPASYTQSHPSTPDTPVYLHPMHNHTHAHLTLLHTCILRIITPMHTWHSCIPASYAQSHLGTPDTPVYLHPMDSHITRYVTNYTAVQNSYQETETPSAGTNLSAVSQHNPLPYQYMSKAIPDIQNHWSSMPKDDRLTRYDFPLVFYSNHRSRLNHCQIRSYCNSHERYVKNNKPQCIQWSHSRYFFSRHKS